MRKDLARSWLTSVGLVGALVASVVPGQAQVRGVYPLGMNATNSGVTPGAGFTYANALLFYSRDQVRGRNGEVLATGRQYVLMDLNTLVWVSDKKLWFLGGAVPSASATLPVANNFQGVREPVDLPGLLAAACGRAELLVGECNEQERARRRGVGTMPPLDQRTCTSSHGASQGQAPSLIPSEFVTHRQGARTP